jgi:hypothetical protein
MIATPKKSGGWGLKDIHLFGHSLVDKIFMVVDYQGQFMEKDHYSEVHCTKLLTRLDKVRKEEHSKCFQPMESFNHNFPVIGKYLARR